MDVAVGQVASTLASPVDSVARVSASTATASQTTVSPLTDRANAFFGHSRNNNASALASESLLTVQGLGTIADPENANANTATRKDDTAGDNPETEDSAQAEEEAASTEAEEKASDGLTSAERQVVQSLRQRDAEVRRHEEAHVAAGGPYAGAPRYEYETGPDRRQYATDGEVSIDAGKVPGDPQATIEKLQIVRRAALAPAEPSPQDQRVAARADQGINEARAELRNLQAAERQKEAEEAQEEASETPESPETTEKSGTTAQDSETASEPAAETTRATVNADGVTAQQAAQALADAAQLQQVAAPPAQTAQPAAVQASV